MATEQMLLMGVTPDEQIYGVLDSSDGLVVGSGYVRRVPVWGYLTRVPDVMLINTEVHRKLWNKLDLSLTVTERKKMRHLLQDAVPEHETHRKPVSDLEILNAGYGREKND
jgi:hypothetical protein